MTKQQAVYTAFLLADALNTIEVKDMLQRGYGTRGIAGAVQGITELAKEYGFDPPPLEKHVLLA